MSNNNETSSPVDNEEAIADITDQTLADEQPGDVPASEESPVDSDDPAALRARLEETHRKLDAEHDACLRALADFANYKRRTGEDAARQRDIVRESLLDGLLPIVDNFERALASAQATQDYDKLIGGVQAILRQFQEFLIREGVTEIEAVGQPFDPNFHNAVMRYETTEYPENTVVEELQKGYALGKRVLRPSMVKVAAGTE